MLAHCAEDAQGRYLPYGEASVMPIRGGLITIGARTAYSDT